MTDKYIVLVRKKNGKKYFRAVPETAEKPTVNQAITRINFGEAAKKAKGKKFTGTLPPAAEIVREELRGKKVGRTVKLKKWEEILLKEAKKEGKKKYEEILKVVEEWLH